mgnify:CR=1 FL=1
MQEGDGRSSEAYEGGRAEQGVEPVAGECKGEEGGGAVGAEGSALVGPCLGLSAQRGWSHGFNIIVQGFSQSNQEWR